MNFFFGLKVPELKCKITIPKFTNRTDEINNYNLFEAKISNNRWIISKKNCDENNNFYFLEDNQIDNHNIFFLSNKQELEKNYKDNFFEKLKPLNNFTNTDPAYRSNLSIFFDKGGSSSFQSEYPFQMIYTNKSKFILSSLFMLSNAEAFNYLCLRNIFNEPIIEKFPLFFININEKKVLKEFQIETNMTNIIEIDKEFIKPEVFLVSKNYPCLPMFVSLKNGHISFEHTQAPHEYIMSADKFKTVKSLKKFVDDFIIR